MPDKGPRFCPLRRSNDALRDKGLGVLEGGAERLPPFFIGGGSVGYALDAATLL